MAKWEHKQYANTGENGGPGYQVLIERSILVVELQLEKSLKQPRETLFHHGLTPPRALLYPHPVIASICISAALASCALTHLRNVFTF